MNVRAEIPLFPLSTVLFPGGLLPLRIFETRYVDLVSRCLRENSGFGVVLIEAGQESGESARVFDVGCYAKIVDFSRQEDGLLGIVAEGSHRFRVTATRVQEDGLNLGEVDWLPDASGAELPAEYQPLAAAVDTALDQAGSPYASMKRNLQDANWVSARLAELLPIPNVHKQRCLELGDPLERLDYLRPMFVIDD